MNRKSSSADEFYDAVESIDEIPASSNSASEDIPFCTPSIEQEARCPDAAAAGDTADADANEKMEPHHEHDEPSHSSDGENWASARCLRPENDTVYGRSYSLESNEQWVSARCLVENEPLPSLLDAVASSLSDEDLERVATGGVQQTTLEKVPSADPPGGRLSDLESVADESNGEDAQTRNILESVEEELKTTKRQSLVESESAHHEEHTTVVECCTMTENIQTHHNRENVTLTGSYHEQEFHQQKVDSEERISARGKENTSRSLSLNPDEVHSSVEESSCYDRESQNGFLPVESDSISTMNTRTLTPTEEERTGSNSKYSKHETNAQFSTPLHQNTKRSIEDCSVLDYCDLTSPLEALYLMCSDRKKGGALRHQESAEDVNDRSDAASPERLSDSHDVDPKEAAPVSPSEDRAAFHEESDESDDDSSSAASLASFSKFRIVDKDTGSIFDVREVMKDIDEGGESTAFDTRYSFLPSKRELQRRTFASGNDGDFKTDNSGESITGPLMAGSFDSLSSASVKDSPGITMNKGKNANGSTTAKKKTKLSDLKHSIAHKLQKSSLNRKRTASADAMPRNAIHVRSSTRNPTRTTSSADFPLGQPVGSSSFNPMLLVKTMPKSHDGPAWCAAFSIDGRFLATGGEDGNVCIWAVAPKSTAVHPESVGKPQTDEKGFDTPKKEEDVEMKDVGSDSPLTTDTESRSAEKVSNQTAVPEGESSAPPLNFVGSGPELGTNLEIISSAPVQRFKDHTADVIDLSWSHTNFLLTASLDSSVRLYHYSKSQCLHLFKHANLVASVAFHPNDERYFISGGIDKKLRMWSITDGRVKDWAQAPDVITAVRFTPDGKYAVAGLFRGQVYFYESDGLKYYTQIACRNRSGRYKMGRKVTGISFVRGERDDWIPRKNSTPGSESSTTIENSITRITEAGNRVVKRISLPFKGTNAEVEALRYTERMLVSTNDSRVRLYGLNDFCLVRKYKGHANYSMQIRARISESGDFIASGSESGHVFLWKTLDKEWMAKHNINTKLHQTKDKAKSSDYFEASKAQLPIVTDTVFFPYQSVREALLSSQLFPFQLSMDRVGDDLSSAAILTLDYDGTMRVFLRKSCIDNLLDAATPRGGHLA